MVVPVELPTWWVVLLATTFTLAVTISVVVPILVAGYIWKGSLNKDDGERRGVGHGGKTDTPVIMRREWHQASQLPGCPWNFKGCEDIKSAINCIWQLPLPQEMRRSLDSILGKIQNLSVARVALADEVYFVAIYTLKSGAEVFGGAPLDFMVDLTADAVLCTEPSDEKAMVHESSSAPTRSRRWCGSGSSREQREQKESDLCVPSLMPFYRVHDGFGVLRSTKHLVELLTYSNDSVGGSTFYVYPRRSLETVARRPDLVKFARVDRNCVVCVDLRKDHPSITLVERSGETISSGLSALAFVADTIMNICGVRDKVSLTV